MNFSDKEGKKEQAKKRERWGTQKKVIRITRGLPLMRKGREDWTKGRNAKDLLGLHVEQCFGMED